jgi:hypothetical protein
MSLIKAPARHRVPPPRPTDGAVPGPEVLLLPGACRSGPGEGDGHAGRGAADVAVVSGPRGRHGGGVAGSGQQVGQHQVPRTRSLAAIPSETRARARFSETRAVQPGRRTAFSETKPPGRTSFSETEPDLHWTRFDETGGTRLSH